MNTILRLIRPGPVFPRGPKSLLWAALNEVVRLPLCTNNKAYLFTGINNGKTDQVNDMWQYDPATSLWTAKRPIANVSAETYDDTYAIVRQNAVAFVMNGKRVYQLR